MFLVASGTTLAGVLLAACGASTEEVGISEVPVGSAVIVGSFIIAQPRAGEFKAYSTRCPHQGNTIDTVDGSEVICRAHQSHFSVEDGHPTEGPARSSLTEATVEINGEQLTVTGA